MSGYVREMTATYRRVATSQSFVGKALNSPAAVTELVSGLIGHAAQERFVVLHLDVRNRLRSYSTVSIGGVSVCPVIIGEIFKGALLANAAGVIVSHNHPSGDPQPSRQDDLLTERAVHGGRLLDIPVLDHVIVTADGQSYSYAERGRLEP